MNEPLRVAILWHMHQPYYLDDLTGRVTLPWVRLHATKAYLDMIYIMEQHPEMACTINVVPSLLAQLRAYETRDDIDDTYLNLSQKPAAELDPGERKLILSSFFMSNWDTMVRPHPGYERLLSLRGISVDPDNIDAAYGRFTNQDYLDLQVWFNLSWFGFSARRDERVAALIKKDRGYSEADKQMLLAVQAEMMSNVIPGWKRLFESGKVELSTSPFYHPILPILMGTDVVKRSTPEITLPGDFSFVQDAQEQLDRGVEFFREIFGKPPVGIWPSEGSVCSEIVPLLANAGIQWTATDESILLRSLTNAVRERDLYQPYKASYNGHEISIFFRDRYLSDLIGFTYSKNPADLAVENLTNHLTRIAENHPGETVSIFLDGENPWEYYPDSGEDFLNGLCQNLVSKKELKPVSMRQALAENPPRKTITKLHAGSWINANFNIWIGKIEENKAWTALQRARGALEIAKQANKAPAADLQTATEQLYQAEGSDWFWWFDDDFNSENDAEFDRLFREKLANIYRLLQQRVPAFLEEPFHKERENLLIAKPLALIHPTIDGQVTHFYEWRDAGFVDISQVRGSMHLSKNLLAGLFFGFDQHSLFLRLDPDEEHLRFADHQFEARIHLMGQVERQIRFPLSFHSTPIEEFQVMHQNKANEWEQIDLLPHIRVDQIGEIAIPFSILEVKPGQPLWFVVHITKGGIEEDRYPKNGRVLISVPDPDYDSINWSV